MCQRNHSDVGRASADVDDHVAERRGDGQARPDGAHHVHQVDLASPRAQRAVLHRPALHLRNFRRHADHDARANPQGAMRGAADEVGQHPLGGLEVRDDAVAERPDGDQIARGPADHVPRLAAHGFDPVQGRIERHDGRFVQDDATAGDEHAGVGRSQINREIGCKAEEPSEHARSVVC
jgi:hypothetical protein